MYLVNPGYISNDYQAELLSYNKFLTGDLQEVATLGFSAAKIFRRDNESAHLARLSVLNEKQGPYISSPRASANYAYELPLAEEMFLSGGVAAGVSGMNYTGVSSTGAVNVFLPDASAGLVFKFRKLQLGIAGLQLPDSKTKPYYAQLVFNRYYHFHFRHQLELNENWNFHYFSLYRLLPKSKNEFLAGGSIAFMRTIELGAIVRSNAGLSVFGEAALDSENNRLSIIFTYNSPSYRIKTSALNSIELGVGYQIK